MSGVAAGPTRVALLTNQTVDETTSVAVPMAGMTAVVFYVTGTGTTSSGVITIEEGEWWDGPDTPFAQTPYAGTWSPITTVDASDVSGGQQKAIHLPVAAYGFLRARISTVIGGGGSISVVVRAS